MGTIAIIPARGGSKGFPGKNLVPLKERPLIAWTIEAALDAGIDLVLVSTDSEDIADAARTAGAAVPWLRPAELSGDDAGSLPVVLHAIRHEDAETVIFLQPTSPLRTAADINEALLLHMQTGRPVVSVVSAKPWLFFVQPGGLKRALDFPDRRQSVEVVAPNGAIYIARASALRAGGSWWDDPVPYLMPRERSVDIDTPVDMIVAETLVSKRRHTVSETEAYLMAAT